jgi:hypothetical protein
MAGMKKVERILTDEVKGGFRMTFECEQGEIFQFLTTEAQVNDLIEELDELLGSDDADEAGDDEKEHVGEEQPS